VLCSAVYLKVLSTSKQDIRTAFTCQSSLLRCEEDAQGRGEVGEGLMTGAPPNIMICHVTLRHVMLRYAMLRYVMLCYVMLSYNSVTRMLQRRGEAGEGLATTGTPSRLQVCYKGVTRVLQGCYKGVTRVLQGC
jgi:hypothetical protein